MPKGVVIPPSFYEALRPLDSLDRLSVLEAVLEYGLYGVMPDLPPTLNGYFLLMQPIVDSSQRRYAAAVENGKKGGAPKGNRNAMRKNNQSNNQTDNQDLYSDSDIDSDSDCEKEKEKEFQEGGIQYRSSPLSDRQQIEADYAQRRDEWIERLNEMKGDYHGKESL